MMLLLCQVRKHLEAGPQLVECAAACLVNHQLMDDAPIHRHLSPSRVSLKAHYLVAKAVLADPTKAARLLVHM